MARLLAQELKSRTQSPAEFDWEALYQELLGYPPYPKQLAFHRCTAKEIFYGGAAGGGKTTTLLMHMIGRCRQTAGFHGAIFRRTFPELERQGSHIPKSHELLARWVSAGICKYNEQRRTWSFNNGSTFTFCHCENEKDITSYNTAEYQEISVDESRDWVLHMYLYLMSRLRTSRRMFTRMTCASNPGGIGHAWMLKRFVKPPVEIKPDGFPRWDGEVWTPLAATEDERQRGVLPVSRAFIQALLDDNTVMMRNNPGYRQQLEMLPEPMRSMLLLGRWDVYAGQAFQEWDDEKHVVDPYPIPAHWERFRSMDWGYSRPYCVDFWAVDVTVPPPFRLVNYHEIYGWGGEDDKGSREDPLRVAAKIIEFEIAEKARGATVYPGPADRMIFSKGNDGGASIHETMARVGINWVPADQSPNSRKHGKLLFHTRLKLCIDGKPGIVFFRNCIHAARTIPTLPLKENDCEDVDTKAEDHKYDSARYAVQFRTPPPKDEDTPKTMMQIDKERVAGALAEQYRAISGWGDL